LKAAEAEMEIAFDSEDEAEAIYRALLPEITSAPTDRARADLNLMGKNIYIKIEAKDAASFRAAINTYSRWIKVARSVMEV
jgi:KEOPS complex subunit Pcc1